MADPTYITTLANFGPNVLTAEYLESVFVSALRKKLVTTVLGVPSSLPEGMGKVVTWQFFNNPTAVSAITEGATPSENANMTTATAQATLAEYGDWVELSKLLMKTAVTNTVEEAAAWVGYSGALSLDTVSIGVVDGSTNTQDAGVAMTANELRKAVQNLDDNDNVTHRATPGGDFYCGVFRTEGAYDMMGEGAPAWFQAKSSDYEAALRTPFEGTPATAALYKCIIKVSNNVQRNAAASPDDDLNCVIADEAFGVAALDTDVIQPRVIVTPPEARVDKPLRNAGTLGWDAFFAAVLFDNNRVRVVLSDATGVGA